MEIRFKLSKVTPYGLVLAGFTLLGLLLRCYGLNNGLPYVIPADESVMVDAGTHILKTGDFDPHQYFYPGFYIYLQTLVYVLHFLWGSFTGFYQDVVKDLPDKTYDVTSAPGFYMWGRALTVLIGTASIPLIYWLVKRIWNDRRVALLAAGLLTFSAQAIENSQYISVDVPMAFLVLLALGPAWIIAERGQRRGYVLVGLVCGLAVGTKWNATLVVLLALVAHLLYHYHSRRLRQVLNLNLLILLAVTVLTTLATTPFAIADMRPYVDTFILNLSKYRLSGGAYSSDTPWLSNLGVLWDDSAAVALLAAGGVLLAVLRHNRRDLLLLSFPLAYLLYFNQFRIIYPRNMLPLVYYGEILAALFAIWVFDKVSSRFKVQGSKFKVQSSEFLVSSSESVQGSRFKVQSSESAQGLRWNTPSGAGVQGSRLENSSTPNPFPILHPSSLIPILGIVVLVFGLMYAPIRNSLYGGWFNSQPFSYQRVGDWLERNAGPGPLKLAELRPQQWPKGYPNLFAVRDEPTKIGNQADAHPLAYYRERGIAYLAINNDRAGPFLQSGKGNYPDLFANGQIVEKIETRAVEKPGPAFTIIATGVTPQTLKLQHPLPTEFSPALTLIGFNLGQVKAENEIYLPPEGQIKGDWPVFKPGQILGLSVYWQPQAKIERDYVIFIHLSPVAKPDTNAAARDTQPLLGAYPTSRWKPGEIVTDSPNLALPADLAPGDYNLVMGLYALNPDGSLTPLPTAQGQNSVKLGTLKIQK